MGVEEASFELEHELTDATKTEMSGLDDAGVDRADGHLDHTVATHARDRPVRMGIARDGSTSVEVLS